MDSDIACDAAVVEPLAERLDVSTLCAFAQTCTTWRDAANNPRIWRALCTSKWSWLGGLPVDAIDWKERYKTLAKCGRANPLQEMINLDDYDFFITARVAKPPEGKDEGDLLFIHRATWYERFSHLYVYPPGDSHPVTGAALSVTLDEPLNLPEGLLNIYTEDGETEIEGMMPIKLMVHAHYKPTGKVAHMVSLHIPDNNYDFDHRFLFTRSLGVGAGTWHPNLMSDGKDYGFCEFDEAPWISCIKENHPQFLHDSLEAEASLSLDDQQRLTGLELLLFREGGQNEYMGPSWRCRCTWPTSTGVCKALDWA